MGPIQLTITMAAFVIIKNYFYEKEKRKITVTETIIEIIGVVSLIMIIDYFILDGIKKLKGG
ncbi:hypothetical protein [Siminovitchia fortis]|uniref:Uncharacterized protein n=1 Tax=Siminovitchia fortis TaxID=254758 RepID=A0A443IUU5_9BACI|nr:hypothetical protein [Siminovitchia fortis]RWR11878.1 hypothetical protein D4N35_008040 [Siminovitchia fortis]WHY81841.1 hypothetical protein QNH23_18580 [Siminovitchia fortis]